MRKGQVSGIKKFLLDYICMPIFLACICFILLYTVVCSRIGRPELYLDTLRVAFGGDRPFIDEFEDIFEPGNNESVSDNTQGNTVTPPFTDITIPGSGSEEQPDFNDIQDPDIPNPEPGTNPDPAENTVKLSSIRFPHFNHIYGRFEIPSIGIRQELIMGESELGIARGVCQSTDSYIPGYGGTIKLTIHNHKVRTVENLKTGDEIRLTTNYGVYVYKVQNISVVEHTDSDAFRVYTDKNDLVFYTCYPLTRPSTTQRLVVRAVQVSGPRIVKD